MKLTRDWRSNFLRILASEVTCQSTSLENIYKFIYVDNSKDNEEFKYVI